MSAARTKQNINVIVRCRPLNKHECDRNSYNILEFGRDKKSVTVKEKLGSVSTAKTFTFDRVFGPTTKQIDVYKSAIQPAVDEVLLGYNCTIFAYGQTGSGKTYTMEGERSVAELSWEADPQAGVVPRSIAHLFKMLESTDCEFSVRVSYLELYNEQLFDLLGSSEEADKLRIYDDPSKKGSVVIQGLEEVVVRNKEEIHHILEKGRVRRQTAATLLNATSSRSHSVFMVTVRMKENSVEGEELVRTGKLNLVDLAGSENIGRSGAIEKRAREAGSINQSLLTLGRVITSLVDHTPHVPYRESKLTRILRDSLGGRTKTSIIATISPASLNLEETVSTLDYAHRAKNITNKPEVNQTLTKKDLIKEYNDEIDKLRKDLQASRDRNGIYIAEENYLQMRGQIQSQSDLILSQHDRIASISEELLKVQELFSTTEEQLCVTRGQLAVTEDHLTDVDGRLKRTRNTLRHTRRERDERGVLLEERAKTERDLSEQATQLLEVAHTTTQDIELLHSKIDRKSQVESHNEAATGAVHTTLGQSVEKALERGRAHCLQMDTLRTDYQTRLDNSRSKQTDLVKDLLSNLTAYEHQFKHGVESLCQLGNSGCTQAEEDMAHVAESASTFETASAENVSQWVEKFHSSLSALQNLIKEGRELEEENNLTMSQMTQKHREIMDNLAANVQRESEAFCHAARERAECQEAQRVQAQQIMDQFMEQFQVCQAASAALEKEQLAGSLAFATSTDDSCRSAATAHSHTCDTMAENMASVHSRGSEINGQLTEVASQLQTGQNDFYQANEANRATLQGEIRKRAADVADVLPTKRAQLAEQEKASLTKAAESAHTMTELVESYQQEAGTTQELSGETVDQCAQLAGETAEELMETLQSDSDTVSAFVQGFRKDIPTGKTPARRGYTYPSHLAQTRPDDQLLSSYREGYLDESMEESFVLPPSFTAEAQLMPLTSSTHPTAEDSTGGKRSPDSLCSTSTSADDSKASVASSECAEPAVTEKEKPEPKNSENTSKRHIATPRRTGTPMQKGSTAKTTQHRPKVKKPLGPLNK